MKHLSKILDHTVDFYDRSGYWRKRNWFYHQSLDEFLRFLIPPEKKSLKLSITELNDFSVEQNKIDYFVLTDLLGYLRDIEIFFRELHVSGDDDTRLVITQYNKLWEPLLRLGAALKLRMPYANQSWVSVADIENFLYLAGYEVVKKGAKLLLPIYIPLLSWLCNKYLVNIFPFNKLALVNYVIARKLEKKSVDASVSVIVPARNEAGTIQKIVKEIPLMGRETEVIFVEGHSTDNTLEEIKRAVAEYRGDKKVKYVVQSGKGKGDAVRKGFAMATGDILMIYDADMTVPPDELSKFYSALIGGRGDFINGSRLVYPMEKLSMRTLNFVGNKFFSLAFSWLLGQRIKDTLCGTKVLWKKDYLAIERGRQGFGEFDPFGDFDLLFGAAKLNLKIIDLPVHYRERTYGTTNIDRWRHGWLLLKMVVFAMRKIKFI